MKNFSLSIALLFILPILILGQQEGEIRADGIVVPKITNAERPSPATLGHLVYNTSQNQFEYYNGVNWIPFSSGGGVSDIIQTTGGESYVRVINGVTSDYIDLRIDNSTRFRVIENADNVCRLEVFNTGDNLLIGNGAGVSLGFNVSNLGENNIAIGENALNDAVTNDNNIAIGNFALATVKQDQSSTTGFGNNNVAVGHQAMGEVDALTTGSVAIGFESGKDGGANSVYIGKSAGVSSSDNGNNRLFIANGTGKPLIYGEFDNNFVEVDGQLMATKDGINTSPTYVGVLESVTSQRPSLLFSVGGNQSLGGMALEYDARSTLIENQLNLRNNLDNVIFSIIEDGDLELTGDIDRPGGELDIRAGGSLGITIETNGEVGIGTTNPTAALDVDGTTRIRNLSGGGTADVQADNNGNLVKVASDIRLKKDVTLIKGALDKVLKLRGVSYNWKHLENQNKTLGVIAQEVLDVLPEVVRDDGEYLGVNYSEFPALFIEAFKEQQLIIDKLKSSLKVKEELLVELKARVEKLESLKSH